MMPYGNDIAVEGMRQLMLMEDPRGSNSGPALNAYLDGTGFEPGEPWCLYFARAVLQHALASVGCARFWDLHTGSCEQYYQGAKAQGRILPYESRGAIYLLRDSAGHHFHAGIGLHAGAMQGQYTGVEGNTNNDGGAEGYGVFVHTRYINRLDFVDWRVA